jgi:hypothetical protein
MDTFKTIMLGIGIVAATVNILVCYRVARSDSFEMHQKYIQCVLIWLLPFIGAAVAYVFTREPKMNVHRYSENAPTYGIGDVGFGDGAGDFFSGGFNGD